MMLINIYGLKPVVFLQKCRSIINGLKAVVLTAFHAIRIFSGSQLVGHFSHYGEGPPHIGGNHGGLLVLHYFREAFLRRKSPVPRTPEHALNLLGAEFKFTSGRYSVYVL